MNQIVTAFSDTHCTKNAVVYRCSDIHCTKNADVYIYQYTVISGKDTKPSIKRLFKKDSFHLLGPDT